MKVLIKQIFLVTLILLINLNSVLAAEQTFQEKIQESLKKALKTGLSIPGSVAPFLPGKMACAADVYFNTLKPELYTGLDMAGQGNVGFAETMSEQYHQSKCFRVALDKFYKEVDKYDALSSEKRKQNLTPGHKPSITTTVSQLNVPEVKNGWMLEAAKKVSGGDPMFALQLIAFCGHDDANQVKNSALSLEQVPSKNTSRSNPIFIDCPPPSSLMYFQNSLSENDKTSNYALELLKKYRPISSNTGSKSYHTLAGAYLGCKLQEKCGLTLEESNKYERMATYIYRSMRLLMNNYSTYQKYKSELDSYMNIVSSSKLNETGKSDLLVSMLLEKIKKDNPNLPAEKQLTLQQMQKKAKSESIDLLAYTVYSQTRLVLKVGDTNFKDNSKLDLNSLFSSTLENITSQDISQENNFLIDENSLKFKNQCRSIARELCGDVTNKIKDWNADFIWSMSQHSVGNKLGHELCKTSKEDRAGSAPKVCEQYNKEPDLNRSNMTIRSGSDEKPEIDIKSEPLKKVSN